jgi:hypothetical protein
MHELQDNNEIAYNDLCLEYYKSQNAGIRHTIAGAEKVGPKGSVLTRHLTAIN